MIIQGLVRLPYADLSGVYKDFSTRFDVFLVNQHSADADVKTTHCHFLLEMGNSFSNLDSLRKWFKSFSPLLKRGIYELKSLTQEKRIPYDRLILARYILKGEMPLYYKGFSQIEIINLMAEWSEPAPQAPASAASPIQSIQTKQNKLTQWELTMEMCEEEDERFGLPEEGSTQVFRNYWTKRKDQHIPPQWLRDIVLKVCKRHKVFPHSEQVRKFIGAIFNMVDTDVNYNDYEEACIRGFNYKFSG